MHEAAGQRPLAFERFQRALNQQHFEFAFVEAEDDAVHSEGGSGILVCVWHKRCQVVASYSAITSISPTMFRFISAKSSAGIHNSW